MTLLKRASYSGERPVCSNQPIMFLGGFSLDTIETSYEAGIIIPAGTLAAYNELTRKVQLLTTARVKEMSDDKKFIYLETSPFFSPIFVAGNTITNGSANATIKQIGVTNYSYRITLEKEIAGLKEGDVLWQTSASGKDIVPTALVIADTIVTDPSQIAIDISIDSGAGAWYLRRIPPIPSHFIENNLLKANPNIKFTNSL